MLVATLLITLGALGRRWRNGRTSGKGASARPEEGFRWRNARAAVPIALTSVGAITTAVAVVCC
ncbi:hypothetical protein [Nocardia grenadensis]|uniref:hypothetical protein n=1 Tax=Nocardia grenadensis TaxID=931537 RepID=UPI0007A52B7B|nr:hypothetical protein [Nocardia grenadensis]